METETIFILLFVVATAVVIAVQRLAVPYTVALVFTGLVLGLLHAFEAPHLTKALLFSVFLPGLLFEAACHIEFKQFWQNRFAISSSQACSFASSTNGPIRPSPSCLVR